MNKLIQRRNLAPISFTLLATVFSVLCFAPAQAQQPQQQSEAQPVQPNQDPLMDLQLTPDQRQQIREVRDLTKEERNAANLRLLKAQRAYDDALDAEQPSEELITQRARDVGDAQVALMRVRALVELRIRRILTPQQRARLREIRIINAGLRRREQRLENQGNQGGRRVPPNQGNGISPSPAMRRNGLPRRPGLRLFGLRQ